jgi:hypothetical protein
MEPDPGQVSPGLELGDASVGGRSCRGERGRWQRVAAGAEHGGARRGRRALARLVRKVGGADRGGVDDGFDALRVNALHPGLGVGEDRRVVRVHAWRRRRPRRSSSGGGRRGRGGGRLRAGRRGGRRGGRAGPRRSGWRRAGRRGFHLSARRRRRPSAASRGVEDDFLKAISRICRRSGLAALAAGAPESLKTMCKRHAGAVTAIGARAPPPPRARRRAAPRTTAAVAALVLLQH